MEDIPISFEYKGAQHNGFFSQVHGAGARVWHLMINKYYHGQLLFTERGWVFYNQKREMEELAEFFGEYLVLWYE